MSSGNITLHNDGATRHVPRVETVSEDGEDDDETTDSSSSSGDGGPPAAVATAAVAFVLELNHNSRDLPKQQPTSSLDGGSSSSSSSEEEEEKDIVEEQEESPQPRPPSLDSNESEDMTLLGLGSNDGGCDVDDDVAIDWNNNNLTVLGLADATNTTTIPAKDSQQQQLRQKRGMTDLTTNIAATTSSGLPPPSPRNRGKAKNVGRGLAKFHATASTTGKGLLSSSSLSSSSLLGVPREKECGDDYDDVELPPPKGTIPGCGPIGTMIDDDCSSALTDDDNNNHKGVGGRAYASTVTAANAAGGGASIASDTITVDSPGNPFDDLSDASSTATDSVVVVQQERGGGGGTTNTRHEWDWILEYAAPNRSAAASASAPIMPLQQKKQTEKRGPPPPPPHAAAPLSTSSSQKLMRACLVKSESTRSNRTTHSAETEPRENTTNAPTERRRRPQQHSLLSVEPTISQASPCMELSWEPPLVASDSAELSVYYDDDKNNNKWTNSSQQQHGLKQKRQQQSPTQPPQQTAKLFPSFFSVFSSNSGKSRFLGRGADTSATDNSSSNTATGSSSSNTDDPVFLVPSLLSGGETSSSSARQQQPQQQQAATARSILEKNGSGARASTSAADPESQLHDDGDSSEQNIPKRFGAVLQMFGERRHKKRHLLLLAVLLVVLIVVVTAVTVSVTRSSSTSPSVSSSSTDTTITPTPTQQNVSTIITGIPAPVLQVGVTGDTNSRNNSYNVERQHEWRAAPGGLDLGKVVAMNRDGSVVAMVERRFPLLSSNDDNDGTTATSNSNSRWVVHLVQPQNISTKQQHQSILLDDGEEIHSLSMNHDATVLAVGLLKGTVRAFQQEPERGLWVPMGEPIRDAALMTTAASGVEVESEASRNHSEVSVSLSEDGQVLAMGLITSWNLPFFQVMQFLDGQWTTLGNAIQLEEENDSKDYVAASVALSSTCSLTTNQGGGGCILATSLTFRLGGKLLYGIITPLELSEDHNRWNTLGEALPLSIYGGRISLSENGTIMAVSDAKSTAIYRLHRNSTATSADTPRDEWRTLGLQDMWLPKASQISLASSGRRVALLVNSTAASAETPTGPENDKEEVWIYDFIDIRDKRSENSFWNLTRSVTVVEEAEESGGQSSSVTTTTSTGERILSIVLSPNGQRVAIGDPQSFLETGRVVLLDV